MARLFHPALLLYFAIFQIVAHGGGNFHHSVLLRLLSARLHHEGLAGVYVDWTADRHIDYDDHRL